MGVSKYIVLDDSLKENDCKIEHDNYGNETCSRLMGLAGAAHSCYNRHCVLVVRPDDFWLTFLTAFMQYCGKAKNKTASAKHLFENKKVPDTAIQLKVEFTADNIASAVEDQAIQQLLENGANKELVSLFTTKFDSSMDDHNLAKAFCVLKTYEDYIDLAMVCLCGIPAVKMIGSLKDWKMLKDMVKELREHSKKMNLTAPLPEWWWNLAEDICDNLIISYEETDKEKSVDWWSKIISRERYGSGNQVGYSGWLCQLIMIKQDVDMPVKTRIKHFRVEVPITYNGESNHKFTVDATNWPKFKAGRLDERNEMGVWYKWSIE